MASTASLYSPFRRLDVFQLGQLQPGVLLKHSEHIAVPRHALMLLVVALEDDSGVEVLCNGREPVQVLHGQQTGLIDPDDSPFILACHFSSPRNAATVFASLNPSSRRTVRLALDDGASTATGLSIPAMAVFIMVVLPVPAPLGSG